MEPVPAPVSTKPLTIQPNQIRSTVDLPFSKQHVVIVRGTGRDKRLALMAAGANASGMRISDALAARLCYFFPEDLKGSDIYEISQGKQLRLEDFDDLDLDDSIALMAEMGKVLDPSKARVAATLTLAEEKKEEEELSA